MFLQCIILCAIDRAFQNINCETQKTIFVNADPPLDRGDLKSAVLLSEMEESFGQDQDMMPGGQ